ncbi:MAG TPA: hypothetical protein VED40_23050 [Azospirillaceae bacterium]|nr:hypothetical protein [Azospirillaceae bacterium]
MIEPIAFLDVEASGFGPESYPIEIGWVLSDTDCAEARLILPHPDWVYWDPAAQAVHGIARTELFATGLPGPRVAAWLDANLIGHVVYVGAEDDLFWIDRLYRACNRRPSFRLLEAGRALEAELSRRGLESTSFWTEHPAVHRAVGDAMRLRSVWRRVMGG